MSTQQVNDRPAERGISITNILLSALILLGTLFGTVMTTFMGDISDDTREMKETIGEIRVFNGKAVVEHSILKERVNENKARIETLEAKVNDIP